MKSQQPEDMKTKQDAETQEPISFSYVVEDAMLELKELNIVTQEPLFLKTIVETTVQTKIAEIQEATVQTETSKTQETTNQNISVQTHQEVAQTISIQTQEAKT